MQLIAPLISRPVAGPSLATSTNNASSPSFQMAPAAQSSSPSSAQGFSATANPTLGNQTLYALLQTQDISHAHGHGGGGHHGAKNLMQMAERQETAAGEEGQLMNAPKKLTNTPKLLEASDADEADEEGDPTDDAGERAADEQDKKEKKDN